MALFQKRERFERSDVPTAGPVRNVVSALVMVAVIIGMYILVTTLWRRAHQVEGLSDKSMRTAVRSQAATSGPGEGFVATDHEIVNTLVLVRVDDGSLAQAQILSLDKTAQTGVIANVPLDTKVVAGEVTTSLVAWYAEQGGAACVVPLANAANQTMSHVMVATASIWDQLEQLQGVELAVLLSSAADVLETINSDLSPKDLIALVDDVRAIGVANLRRIDVAVFPEDVAEGVTLNVIDQTALGLELGTIAPVSAEGEETNEATEGTEGTEATEAASDEQPYEEYE